MAFAARNENGKWILCERKNRSIHYAKMTSEHVVCEFKNQKQAKACADDLNNRYWKEFDTARKLGVWQNSLPYDMINLIRQYVK